MFGPFWLTFEKKYLHNLGMIISDIYFHYKEFDCTLCGHVGSVSLDVDHI